MYAHRKFRRNTPINFRGFSLWYCTALPANLRPDSQISDAFRKSDPGNFPRAYTPYYISEISDISEIFPFARTLYYFVQIRFVATWDGKDENWKFIWSQRSLRGTSLRRALGSWLYRQSTGVQLSYCDIIRALLIFRVSQTLSHRSDCYVLPSSRDIQPHLRERSSVPPSSDTP